MFPCRSVSPLIPLGLWLACSGAVVAVGVLAGIDEKSAFFAERRQTLIEQKGGPMARSWMPVSHAVVLPYYRRSPAPGLPGIRTRLSIRLDNGDVYSASVLGQGAGGAQLGNFRDADGQLVLPRVQVGGIATLPWGRAARVYGRFATVRALHASPPTWKWSMAVSSRSRTVESLIAFAFVAR